MAREFDHLICSITAIVCFVFGNYSLLLCSPSFDITTPQAEPQNVHLRPQPAVALEETLVRSHDLVQDEELQAIKTFQERLHKQQSSKDCSRVLIVPIKGGTHSWLHSMEVMAMALKVALSTERRLVVQISGDEKESFCNFAEHEIYCQFMDMLECQASTSTPSDPMVWTSPLRQGIQEDTFSDFFNVQYYGSDDVAVLPNVSAWPWPKSWLLDGGLSWERAWGAFWLRSQLLYYLTGSSMNQNYSLNEGTVNDPIHITLIWDPAAHDSLQRKFARDSAKTLAWDRIQALANYLRGEHKKETKAINYIENWKMVVVIITDESNTDYTHIPFQAQEHWDVVTHRINPQAKPQRQVLESIYSSEFLIGSFASPFFRVFTALHKAKLASNSTEFGVRHYWPLDIEWLEALYGIYR